ncbi:hypothetical protein Thimo_2743 [Thioflavicoccus mobilis 8321]|uniref:Uncharacterized protein n=1 Tax=Thioflavicoccus mobilis 8321 TaxID=765912 RepID=L0GXF4_9GAMM|nr:hypothetical protein [Thioflavicoccus mobilis]AGA91453.1 hypothetical protein Thimo_2743 [Thioflavicoccus mobilis 8321]
MSQEQALVGPDWDSPVQLTLTPALMIHALMATATAVHTGWESCIEEGLVVSSLIAMDEGAGHYVRLVEQEYDDENDPEIAWHDWTLEIRIGRVLTTGHWQAPVGGALLEWEWHAREAEQAFERACVLLGRRVSRGLVVVEPQQSEGPVRSTRH